MLCRQLVESEPANAAVLHLLGVLACQDKRCRFLDRLPPKA